MKKIHVFFGWGKFSEGEKIFLMNRGPEDYLPPVSMKFSRIASGGACIQQLADLRLPGGSRNERLLLTCTKGLGWNVST
jgi:hypothetical protein